MAGRPAGWPDYIENSATCGPSLSAKADLQAMISWSDRPRVWQKKNAALSSSPKYPVNVKQLQCPLMMATPIRERDL